MIINLVQTIPILDDQNHPILDDYKLVQITPKLDDKNHPIMDEHKFGTDYSKIGRLEPFNYGTLLYIFVTI